MINGMAVCAGSGGLELGLKLIFGFKYQCICYIEREGYSAANIVARIQDKTLDKAPIWDDVATFDGTKWRGLVDIISAGFPCQPWSTAGKQKKTKDERWIWADIYRVICEVEPTVIFLENVPNLAKGGLEIILKDLAKVGYDAEWDVFSARAMGAPHIRKRLFILAYSNRPELWDKSGWRSGKNGTKITTILTDIKQSMANTTGKSKRKSNNQKIQTSDQNSIGGINEDLAHASGSRWQEELEDLCRRESDIIGKSLEHTNCQRLEGHQPRQYSYEFPLWPPSPKRRSEWKEILEIWPQTQPAIRGVADGMAPWMDRLRSCGNGVVPVVAAVAFLHLGKRTGLI